MKQTWSTWAELLIRDNSKMVPPTFMVKTSRDVTEFNGQNYILRIHSKFLHVLQKKPRGSILRFKRLYLQSR